MQASEDSNGDLKEARGLLKEAMIEQEDAHVEVQKAAKAAQEAHDLMLQSIALHMRRTPLLSEDVLCRPS